MKTQQPEGTIMINGGDTFRKPLWMRLFAHDISAPLFLLLLALAVFVPGQWSVPPLDRDEPRFTQATKQMLESGDYIDIRFQDDARHKKPVGIYWLQTAAIKLAGYGPDAPLWAYRLPSLFAACLSVLFTYWLARAFTGPPASLIASIFVACAIVVGVEAHLAKTDSVLLASIILAQGALARIWLTDKGVRRWGLAFVFWSALALGTLVKGPVPLMVVGFTVVGIVVLTRKARWIWDAAPVVGFLWFCLLVLPWFVAIGLATDGAFYQEAIGKDLLGKVGQGQESHGAPPLTHLLSMIGTFWPLPGFALLSLALLWRGRASPLVTFCISWFLPSWIVFELVATKLPHYTMPLLPALALPVAVALNEGAGQNAPRLLRFIAAFLLMVVPVAVAVAAFAGPLYLGDWPSPPGGVLAVLGAVLGLMAAARLLHGASVQAIPLAVGASLAMSAGIWAFSGPDLQKIWISPRLKTAVSEVTPCQNPAVVTVGFHEPSFVFLQGTQTAIVSGAEAAQFLAGHTTAGIADVELARCRIAVVESRQSDEFLKAMAGNGLVPSPLKTVEGLNINGGKNTKIAIYAVP